MKKNLAILIAAVALILSANALLDFSRLSGGSWAKPRSASGRIVEDFSFTTLANEQRQLSSFRGRVVVLNFWASWCTPCVAEFPALLNLARAMPDDMALIALSVDEERGNLDRFLKRHGGDYAKLENVVIGHDPKRHITETIFSTFRLPETVIIAPDGTFVRKIIGYSDEWSSEEMKDSLKSLMP